jgi:hypothetical protein
MEGQMDETDTKSSPDEIEITYTMMMAGALVIERYSRFDTDPAHVAKEVYRAMIHDAARPARPGQAGARVREMFTEELQQCVAVETGCNKVGVEITPAMADAGADIAGAVYAKSQISEAAPISLAVGEELTIYRTEARPIKVRITKAIIPRSGPN